MHSCNGDPKMADDEACSRSGVPVSVRLLHVRIALMAGTFVAVMLPFMVLVFVGKTFQLRTFILPYDNADYTVVASYTDDMHSLSSGIIALFNKPKDWIISSILPVCFLTFAASRRMQTKPALVITMVFIGAEMFINYLINNGFQAISVQWEQGDVVPFITASDMAADNSALLNLLNRTSTASRLHPEKGANLVTNTVLRNLVAPIVLMASQPKCSPTVDDNMVDTSEFTTGLMQSYGFPAQSWQSAMLPINHNANDHTYRVSLSNNTTDFQDANLNMSVNMVANLFIHGIHVSRYFFRWFNASDGPLNATRLLMNSTILDAMSSDQINATTYLIPATKLFSLVPPDLSSEDKVTWFLGAARDLLRDSLSSNANITATESNMTFSHGVIADTGNITYHAVTFDVPLRQNFYYRKLIPDGHDDLLVEDESKTALHTNISNLNDTSDIYYDLDKSNDCGPYPGSCVMPRVQEYDFYGYKYQPDPQIKATAVCLNANGSEEFMIEYRNHTGSGNGSKSYVDAVWACNNKSTTSMYIVSFSSRIIGDKMFDTRAPDAVNTSLDHFRATLLNPRKIYSLTVVRLAWNLINFEDAFNASCDRGEGNCTGLSYQLDLSADGSANGTATNQKAKKVILVGSSSILVTDLSPFSYNNMELEPMKFAATRWLPLMTLATPADDTQLGFSLKGDALFPYNFKSFIWDPEVRSGVICSDSAEDFMNHVVNNHYYMDNGLQASFTAGMYYLFQNGVERNVHSLTETQWTLAFDGNMQRVHVNMSIPRTNFVFTCVGIGLVFFASLFVVATSRNGQRPLIKKTVGVDMISEMIRDENKYPPFLLECRFGTTDIKGPYEQYYIDGLCLRQTNGEKLSVCSSYDFGKPLTTQEDTVEANDVKPKISESYTQRKSDTDDSSSSSKSSETNVLQE